MKVELKVEGLGAALAMLQSLPAEIVSKRGGPVKTALRKAAQVVRKQEIINLRTVTSNQTASGEKESTGFLAKNVIVSRGKMPAGVKGEKYLVRIKRKQVVTTPDGKARTGKSVTSTIANAQRLEYGTHEQSAEPWIRPAFLSKAAQAISTFERELIPAIEKAVKKGLADNKGKK